MHLAAIFLQKSADIETAQKMALAVFALLPIFILVGVAVVVVPFWFILKKAGFSPWLALINLVPLGSLILLYVVAFSEWKVTPVAQWPAQPPYPPQYPPSYPPQV